MTKMNAIMPWIAAVCSGAMFFLGYAGFEQFYLEWVFLVPLLWAIRDKGPGRAFLIAWVAGTVGHCGGFYWVIGMFQEFAGMAWPLASLGLLLLAACNGVVFALWGWATRFITRATGWRTVWVAPVVWTALEKFWPEVFPNYLGASQYRLSLVTQIADVTGVLGVSFLLVYVNSVIYEMIEEWRGAGRIAWQRAAIAAAVVAAVLLYGGVRIGAVERQMAGAPRLTVGLVQTNRGAGEKRDNPESLLREHQEMSVALAAAERLDLMVWPESVCALEMSSRDGTLPGNFLDGLHTPTLFGAALRLWQGDRPRLYDSAILVDGTGRILDSYDKMVLVPFGEYIPFGDTFPQLYAMLPYTGRFDRGENREPLHFNGHCLSVSICYEDIFPCQIRALMAGGREHCIPEAMFNLTNDSWYGNTSEPIEHLALASFRSIENRRALVRATNTGISAFVDPLGRIAKRSGVWTKETLVDRVPLMHGGTVYGLLGDWLGWLCAGLVLVGIGWAVRRKKHK